MIHEVALSIVSAEAKKRFRAHEHQASHRPLSAKSEIVGVAGDILGPLTFNLSRDSRILPGGDGGIDAILRCGLTVDFKAAQKAYNLLLEVGRPHCADVLVLGQYYEVNGMCRVSWLGWEYGEVVRLRPNKQFGHPVWDHFIPRRQLRSIAEFRTLVSLGT